MVEPYLGYRDLAISKVELDEAYKTGWFPSLAELNPNEYVCITTEGSSALGCYDAEKKSIRLIRSVKAWDVRPKNKEQTFALDALMNDKVPLVTLGGTMGCGKTYIALAAALEKVINQKQYKRIIITRPMEPVGRRQVGFLPGDLDDKMMPWLGGCTDNLEQLLSDFELFYEFIQNGTIEIEALTFMRGRSLTDAFVLVDEAENLSREEAKVVVTRIGRNGKLILMGDTSQLDRDDLNRDTSGLTHVIEAFKPYSIAAHVQLQDGSVRSELAALAAKIL